MRQSQPPLTFSDLTASKTFRLGLAVALLTGAAFVLDLPERCVKFQTNLSALTRTDKAGIERKKTRVTYPSKAEMAAVCDAQAETTIETDPATARVLLLRSAALGGESFDRARDLTQALANLIARSPKPVDSEFVREDIHWLGVMKRCMTVAQVRQDGPTIDAVLDKLRRLSLRRR